jgi:hypothetical protein
LHEWGGDSRRPANMFKSTLPLAPMHLHACLSSLPIHYIYHSINSFWKFILNLLSLP